MLEQKVQCRCVLALTATATKATEADVAKVLKIEPCNVVRDSNVRDNLRLSVTHFNGGMMNECSFSVSEAFLICTTILFCKVCQICSFGTLKATSITSHWQSEFVHAEHKNVLDPGS